MLIFGVLYTCRITRGCASGVSAFIFPIFIFCYFHLSWCNCWISLGWKCSSFFLGCTFCSSSGCSTTIGTLGGSALVNGFYWYASFIWVISWFTCWSFSWYAPLTVTIEDNTGEVVFLNISDRYLNASLCAFLSLTIGSYGAGLCSA